MSEYLYKISIVNNYTFDKPTPPVYIVARDKKEALTLALKHISVPRNSKIGKATCLGIKCSGIIFSGNQKSN